MSYALDLTEGQPMGHAMQTCMIGMRLAAGLHLSADQQSDLYYALLLKDAGCSSNSSKLFHILQSDEIKAKGDLKDKDWTQTTWDSVRYAVDHVAVGKPFFERVRRLVRVAATQQADSCALVKLRCERGASIARQIGFSLDVAMAIASLDEHWNGGGYPMGAKGEEIPLLARIMNLSQTLAVFWTIGGPAAALEVMRKRSGKWFDPELVRLATALGSDGSLWEGLGDDAIQQMVTALEPSDRQLNFDGRRMDDICLAFAEVIDAKSPFTARHSQGVAAAAVAIGERLGLSPGVLIELRRGALLHDIGKLSVPNSILEKPGKLDAAEWQVVQKHPYYTLQILKRVPGFAELSEVAAAHHERLDGKGYFRKWGADQLCLQARILAVADVYDALAAERPYRAALPLEMVLDIMSRETPHALDPQCMEALQSAPVPLPQKPELVPDQQEPVLGPDMIPSHAF
jgi:HD-GYP domain-containing protein (c-di-GMP phosphodiesterase class II)